MVTPKDWFEWGIPDSGRPIAWNIDTSEPVELAERGGEAVTVLALHH
jgi:hypothetical protein